jgi:hypothetical protein
MTKFILLLLAFISTTSFCQEFSLCTSVYGADNKPIEGVTIKIKRGKAIFTTAGQPCFKELQSGDTISFSAVGYTQWKYIVHKNARLSIQLSAQSFVPAFYKNRFFLMSPEAYKYEKLEEKELITTDERYAIVPFKEKSNFINVKIGPGFRGDLKTLGDTLAKGISVRNASKKEGDLEIHFAIGKDSIGEIQVVKKYSDALDKLVIKNLKDTKWKAAVQNGKYLSVFCELHFKARVSDHRLLLELQAEQTYE